MGALESWGLGRDREPEMSIWEVHCASPKIQASQEMFMLLCLTMKCFAVSGNAKYTYALWASTSAPGICPNENTSTKRQVQECSLQHYLSINKLVQLCSGIVYSHEKERVVPSLACMNPANKHGKSQAQKCTHCRLPLRQVQEQAKLFLLLVVRIACGRQTYLKGLEGPPGCR